jgi:hypothetical protein
VRRVPGGHLARGKTKIQRSGETNLWTFVDCAVQRDHVRLEYLKTFSQLFDLMSDDVFYVGSFGKLVREVDVHARLGQKGHPDVPFGYVP